ncbi:MAG: serpin family protein [Aureispira sp.]|nr:serpin family protein [Aureispira sp.]
MNLSKWMLFAFLLGLTACNSDQPNVSNVALVNNVEPEEEEEEEDLGPVDSSKIDSLYEVGDTVAEMDLVEGNTQFAIELFQAMNKPNENMIFSPYSITVALGMVYGGAKGETETQIRKTLHFPEGNVQSFHKALGTLNSKLLKETEGAITIKVANKIWTASGYGLKGGFVEMTKAFYESQAGTFSSKEEGAEKINAWAAKKTNDKIKDILKPSNLDGVRVALANAIYFYGTWDKEFDKEDTREGEFILNDQSTVSVDFMNKELETRVVLEEDYRILELPYKDNKASMVLVLPNEGVTLQQVVANLDGGANYSIWRSNPLDAYEGNVLVRLPKFKIETPTMNLSNAFKEKLGMKIPFEGGADFTKMIRLADIFIGNIFHKAMIEVNEQGTEAAAVTVVTMEGRGMAPKPLMFNANRPFMYLIKESSTNSILFMGQVVNPKE